MILAALGVEQAMAHIGEGEAFGVFGASALGGGLAVYLGGNGGVRQDLPGCHGPS